MPLNISMFIRALQRGVLSFFESLVCALICEGFPATCSCSLWCICLFLACTAFHFISLKCWVRKIHVIYYKIQIRILRESNPAYGRASTGSNMALKEPRKRGLLKLQDALVIKCIVGDIWSWKNFLKAFSVIGGLKKKRTAAGFYTFLLFVLLRRLTMVCCR